MLRVISCAQSHVACGTLRWNINTKEAKLLIFIESLCVCVCPPLWEGARSPDRSSGSQTPVALEVTPGGLPGAESGNVGRRPLGKREGLQHSQDWQQNNENRKGQERARQEGLV